MKILIVYDSVFGNTERTARSIGDAMAAHAKDPGENVVMLRPAEVRLEHLADLRLFVVGSPTRAFQPTPAIRQFLGGIPKNGLRDVRVAAFDTRISANDIKSYVGRLFVKGFGYAAGKIMRRLRKKFGDPVAEAEGFFVEGTKGPLKDGELERAADWARRILRDT